MNISALTNGKSKLLILGVVAIITAGAVVAYTQSKAEPEVNMDFSKVDLAKPNKKKNKPTKQTRIVKPDPAYKVAPEFEDFQAIAKMWVHAMKPYKREVQDWEASIVSLRHQREKIKLYKDAAEAAKGEAEMHKYKNQSAVFQSGKLFLEDNESDKIGEGSDDIVDIENVGKTVDVSAQYSLSNIRVGLYAPGNKFTESSASFEVGEERFFSVKANQVFASQFLVTELDDDSYCAVIKDLDSKKESRVCSN
jgi:hypothetical protein